MAHEITQREDGTAEATYAMEPAWHNLGKVIDHPMLSMEAIKFAGLDWDVEQWPLHAVPEGGDENAQSYPTTGHVANMRPWVDALGNNCHRYLGTVSDSYKVIQNVDAFSFMDGLAEESLVEYEAAGSLFGGKMVWLLARMPGEFVIADSDDIQHNYVLLVNSHAGDRACTVLPTSVRVVCNNTLTWALSRQLASRFVNIRHTGEISTKIEDARLAIAGVGRTFEDHYSLCKDLAGVSATTDSVREFAERVWPDLEPDESGKPRNNSRRITSRNRVVDLMDDAPQQLPAIRGTAWAALNAATQHVDHERFVRGDTEDEMREHRMNSSLLGTNADLKRTALTECVRHYLGDDAAVNAGLIEAT